jgi:hypothetical protein
MKIVYMTASEALNTFIEIDVKLWWSEHLQAYLFEQRPSLWIAWYLGNLAISKDSSTKEEAVEHLIRPS